jgi:two-component system sensor histidine kinase KdpD
MNPKAVRQCVPLILSVIGVVVCSLVIAAIRSVQVIPNLSILYLLPILFAAVTWGRGPALLSAVFAFLIYDFFFVEPVHTFTIRDPEEWLALLIFLVVAAVTSNLAARERARREEAGRRANEATLLYELSRELSGGGSDAALRALAERLMQAFNLEGCAVVISADELRPVTRISVGVETEGEPAALVLGRPSGERRHLGRWIGVRGQPGGGRRPAFAIPLHVGERPLGALRLVGRRSFSPDETRLLATVADQLAAALERERLAREAQQAEILRRTDELRQALLSSVSHDLRTPLASIKASADSLLATGVEWSETDRLTFLMTIDRESDRLNRLVANLLDMSRIEGGALQPQADWYDLGELAREVVARLRPSLRQRELRLDLPDSLPPIEIDYLMIDQVLTNLIENAAKYTPPGAPIEIRVEPRDETLVTSVVDHGPGVPPAERGRVFDKFYRLDPRGKVSGSGLGLAVSRGLVEAHSGRIWVEETPGGGATFCFALPVREPPSGSERPESIESSERPVRPVGPRAGAGERR